MLKIIRVLINQNVKYICKTCYAANIEGRLSFKHGKNVSFAKFKQFARLLILHKFEKVNFKAFFFWLIPRYNFT